MGYTNSQKPIGICDVCGFQYKLNKLRKLVVNGVTTNTRACTECWNPDNPQSNVGKFPVRDDMAVRDPRSDAATHAQSRSQRPAVRGLVSTGKVGTVTVTVS